MKTIKILGLSYLLIFNLPLAWSQTDAARIVGTVMDATGAVIPSAAITVKNEKSGEQRNVTANDQGYYIVTSLSPCRYTIICKAEGLGPVEYKETNLSVGQERTLNIILQPASLTTEVYVSGGEMTVIDRSSASVGANVNAREVATLPLNGRQLSQLYLLAPGA